MGLNFSFVVYGCSLGIVVWIAIMAHIFVYTPHLAGHFWFGMGTLHILVAASWQILSLNAELSFYLLPYFL